MSKNLGLVILRSSLAALATLLAAGATRSEVRLPSVFGDNMVLQQKRRK